MAVKGIWFGRGRSNSVDFAHPLGATRAANSGLTVTKVINTASPGRPARANQTPGPGEKGLTLIPVARPISPATTPASTPQAPAPPPESSPSTESSAESLSLEADRGSGLR